MKYLSNKNVIIFTAHPDDHLLCAGTLMQLSDQGYYLTEVVFTGGEKSVWQGKKSFKALDLKRERLKEWEKASRLIGIKERITLGLPDSETRRDLKTIHKIMKLVRQIRPVLVISHHPLDYHHDHNESAKIVSEAVDRSSWGITPELGLKHKTAVHLYMNGEYSCRTDILIDVSPYEEKLAKLYKIYQSQMSDRMKRLLDAIRMYGGYFSRSKLAESFQIAERRPLIFNQGSMFNALLNSLTQSL